MTSKVKGQGHKLTSSVYVSSLPLLNSGNKMLYLCHQRRAGAYRVGRTRRPHFLLLLYNAHVIILGLLQYLVLENGTVARCLKGLTVSIQITRVAGRTGADRRTDRIYFLQRAPRFATASRGKDQAYYNHFSLCVHFTGAEATLAQQQRYNRHTVTTEYTSVTSHLLTETRIGLQKKRCLAIVTKICTKKSSKLHQCILLRLRLSYQSTVQ